MTNEYRSLEKFKQEFIDSLETPCEDDLDDLEKFETIERFKKLYFNFYKRIEKSEHKKEILKLFDNICDCIDDNKKMEIGLINNGLFNSIIVSMDKSLELDSISIYKKFLNDEPIKIDSESDLKFYEFIDSEFDAIYKNSTQS